MSLIDDALKAGDSVLINEQAALLRKCRAALDAVLSNKPMLAASYYHLGPMSDTLGNLRAELYDYRPRAVFSDDKADDRSSGDS